MMELFSASVMKFYEVAMVGAFESGSRLDGAFGYLQFGLAAVLTLGLIILVHEFGHFIIARALDVRVEKFSIGFGRPIVSRSSGGVEYILGWLPLGGYVKFYGDENVSRSDGEKPADKDFYLNQPIWKRALITAAGSVFNILFAALIFGAISMFGIETATLTIAQTLPDSTASRAGLEAGDEIVALNGVELGSFQELIEAGSELDEKAQLELSVRRGGEILQFSFEPDRIGRIGLIFEPEGDTARVEALLPGPALRAGVELGDEIVAIDGDEIRDLAELIKITRAAPERELIFHIRRDGRDVQIAIEPEATVSIGIIPETFIDRKGPIGAAWHGIEKTVSTIVLMGDIIVKLFTREIPSNQIAGPLGIMSLAGDAAQEGFLYFIGFMAFISLNLGVLNLLPIPVLDGGHLLFLGLEILIRRPVSLKVQEIAQQVGVAALLTLMAFAFYNDITRIFF